MKRGKLICKYLTVGGLITYVVMASLPASSLWFDPGEVRFENVYRGNAPELVFSRTIHRDALISYSTVTRRVETGDVACDGRGGPFTYKPSRGPVGGKDLVWWSGGNVACGGLTPGFYYNQTVWTVVSPMRSLLPEWARGTALDFLLPPKRVVRESPSFEVW